MSNQLPKLKSEKKAEKAALERKAARLKDRDDLVRFALAESSGALYKAYLKEHALYKTGHAALCICGRIKLEGGRCFPCEGDEL